MIQSPTKRLLKALTHPDNVALIGASGNASRLTSRPQRFLSLHGFSGDVFPINPSRETVFGKRAYPTISDVPHAIQHAYILLNSDPAISAFADCRDCGVPVVSILADGFAEAGEEGERRQKYLVDMAREAGILLLGPNSMGVVDTRSGFTCTTNAAFASERLGKGRLAVLSQSGSLLGTILSRGESLGVDFSTFVSLGNEALTGVGHVGEILVEDPDIDGFVLFLETMRYAESFVRFSQRAFDLGKPITAYMTGRSAQGKELSVSHTGAMMGNTAALDSFLRAQGVYRVNQFEALLEAPFALRQLSGRTKNRSKSVTVISTTGGGGAMLIDRLGDSGVDVRGCPQHVREKLEPEGISLGGSLLVDVTLAGTNYQTMSKVVHEITNSPESGIVAITIGSSAKFNPELAVQPIVDVVQANDSRRCARHSFATARRPPSNCAAPEGRHSRVSHVGELRKHAPTSSGGASPLSILRSRIAQ